MHFFILPLKVVFMYCGESKEGISTSFFSPSVIYNVFCRVEKYPCSSGKGFQLLYVSCLSGQGADKVSNQNRWDNCY